MKRQFLLFLFFVFATGVLKAQNFFHSEEPLAHTYSIIARDNETGEMAVGVQSHWFSVGTLVAWGRSGVGVVATQSFVNPSYGPRGLELLASGKSAQEALEILIREDAGRDVRQAAIIDSNGNVAVHTGKMCIDHAGHIRGDNFSVQANMMYSDEVPEAMAEAYEANPDLPLAERVVKALKAAEGAGGDIRGKQSAVLIVVSGDAGQPEWADKSIDLRVDDHDDPLTELSRLLKVHRAYEHMNRGDLEVEHGNMKKALEEYASAEALMPDNMEMKFWKAVTLANNGHVQEAAEILKVVYNDQTGHWKELLKRLPSVNLLTVTDNDFELLLSPGK